MKATTAGMFIVVVVVAAVAGVGGCAVGPNYKAPAPAVPDRWSETAPSGPTTAPSGSTTALSGPTTRPVELGHWWTTLKDPLLDSLIERARESNLDLRVAEARVCEARAQRGVTGADLWPQFNLAGAYAYKGTSENAARMVTPPRWAGLKQQLLSTVASSAVSSALGSGTITSSGLLQSVLGQLGSRLTGANQAAGPTVARAQNLFQAGFDASWEIDVFGGVRRAVEAAEADIAAAEAGYQDVMLILVSEVARNYVEMRGYQRRIAIARDNITAQQETLELTRTRFTAGLTSELDVAQAEAQLATTWSAVPLLEVALREAAHQIDLLLGRYPGTLLAELASAQAAELKLAPVEVPLGLPSDLLRRRPDVRQAERQVAAATARIGVATAELFPRFSITGSSFGSQSHDMRHFLDNKSLLWSVGPGLSWPIFDAGRIRANIQVQDARQAQVLVIYRQVVLTALQDVENALVAYRQEQVRCRYLAQAVTANRRAVALASERYTRGVADFLSVLVSQRSAYAAEDQLVQSESTTVVYLIALYKALGGGWEAETASPRASQHGASPT